eukprot:Em0007g119a
MAEGCGADYTCEECCVSFKCHYALERHKKTRSHCMFVLALKQPEVSKPSLQPDSALDTDDGITQGTDADAGCPSAFDEEDDIAVADCGLDDEFESWMDQISLDINDRQDYKPFPSKMFALLFFLVHGPHPIGNRTLMFIWFILNQTGISVPSLKAVRSFKLPGLDLPKRHVSSQGNPFYCQSVVSTLQLCMANPKIASSLTRYPVQTEGASVPIVEELLLLESEGIEAYDAFSDCQVLVVAPLICVICDNPRAKELCNQLASSTRKYCRICMADKIDSPDVIGVPRTRALSLSQMEEIYSQTSIGRTYNTRKKYGIKEHYNPMLHTNIRADIYKATPLEALHVFALGASKYFLQLFMPDFTHDQKTEILALIKAFNMSGFTTKMYGNVCYYYNSFVGRDFKAWSQMAIFILSPYLDAGRKEVLLNYSKVFAIAYAKSYNRHLKEQWKSVCQNFIDSIKVHFPNLLRRPKMHLILHLIECLEQYGPTSAFSAERCESFNSDVRAQNIYSNRQAPSRDIGKHFAVLEHVRHIIDGGRYGQERCGDSLRTLCSTKPMQAFLYQTSVKELSAHEGIYKPGTPRLVSKQSGHLSVGALTVSVPGMEKCTLFGLAQHDPPYVLSFHHVQLNDKVTKECRGIVAQSFQLVHTGDYVELDVPCELKFGVLLSVCKLAVGSTVCFIQMFEPMFIRIGEPLLSDTDCPMFELSRNIEA